MNVQTTATIGGWREMMLLHVGEKMRDELYGVDFIPEWQGLGPHITVWHGARGGPNCVGATVPAREALQRFVKFFTLADCEWFLKYAQRLANGETVSVAEVSQSYAMHNGGLEISVSDRYEK